MAIEIPTNTIIDKVFAGFKRITPALVAMFLASGAILFLPVHVLELLGLNGLPGKVRTVIGILFLLSITLVITIALSSCWKFVVRKIRRTMVLKNLKKDFLPFRRSKRKSFWNCLKVRIELFCQMLPLETRCIYRTTILFVARVKFYLLGMMRYV